MADIPCTEYRVMVARLEALSDTLHCVAVKMINFNKE